MFLSVRTDLCCDGADNGVPADTESEGTNIETDRPQDVARSYKFDR